MAQALALCALGVGGLENQILRSFWGSELGLNLLTAHSLSLQQAFFFSGA